MTYSSSITNDTTPLTLDASVLINLHACRFGGRILCALPNDILVPEIVASELEHETSRSNGEYQFVQDLVADGIVKVVALDKIGYKIFEKLVLGSPTLDDGEAATIAMAASQNYFSVIDDQKGRNMSQTHLANKPPAWSLDLFCHPQVVADLGEKLSISSLYYALHDGRMRVHENHCDYVVSLIGARCAIECPSLPGYKMRKPLWEESILSDTVSKKCQQV